MAVTGIDHYNVTTSNLERTVRFYEDIVGLKVGPRPPFKTPGAWMYIGDWSVLHVSTMRVPATSKSDAYDHVALRATDIEGTREKLKKHHIKFDEFGVPDRDLYQIFFRDPDGAEIELIFSGDEARRVIEGGAKVDASIGRNT